MKKKSVTLVEMPPPNAKKRKQPNVKKGKELRRDENETERINELLQEHDLSPVEFMSFISAYSNGEISKGSFWYIGTGRDGIMRYYHDGQVVTHVTRPKLKPRKLFIDLTNDDAIDDINNDEMDLDAPLIGVPIISESGIPIGDTEPATPGIVVEEEFIEMEKAREPEFVDHLDIAPYEIWKRILTFALDRKYHYEYFKVSTPFGLRTSCEETIVTDPRFWSFPYETFLALQKTCTLFRDLSIAIAQETVMEPYPCDYCNVQLQRRPFTSAQVFSVDESGNQIIKHVCVSPMDAIYPSNSCRPQKIYCMEQSKLCLLKNKGFYIDTEEKEREMCRQIRAKEHPVVQRILHNYYPQTFQDACIVRYYRQDKQRSKQRAEAIWEPASQPVVCWGCYWEKELRFNEWVGEDQKSQDYQITYFQIVRNLRKKKKKEIRENWPLKLHKIKLPESVVPTRTHTFIVD